MESPGSASEGVRNDLSASEGYLVVITVEYDAHTENEARLRALRDAETLIQQYDVLAVTVGPKGEMAGELFPLTKAYLESKAAE